MLLQHVSRQQNARWPQLSTASFFQVFFQLQRLLLQEAVKGDYCCAGMFSLANRDQGLGQVQVSIAVGVDGDNGRVEEIVGHGRLIN